MTPENKKLAIENELRRVGEALASARALLSLDLFRDSVSRSYYAVYHAACAVLLTKGIEAKSHGGLHTLFSLHFVRPSKLDRKYLRLLSKMQRFREEADYSSEIDFTREDATEALADAETFCAEMKKFLTREGFA